MVKNKCIYADIGAIRKEGFQQYLKNYFWPISEKQYQNKINSLHEKYINLTVKTKDPLLRNLLQIDIALVSELQHIYHYQLVSKFSKENGYRLFYTQISNDFFRPNWKEIQNFYRVKKFPYKKISRLTRFLIRSTLFNKHLGFFGIMKGFLAKKKLIGVGSFDALKKKYIKDTKTFCWHYDWPDLFRNKKYNLPKDRIDVFEKSFLNPYISFLKKLDPCIFDDKFVNNLQKVCLRRIRDLFEMYENCIVFDRNTKLLIAEVGKPHSKIIIFKNHSNSICFHHGSDSGEIIQGNSHEKDSLHCKKFAVPTSAIKDSYEENYSKKTLAQLNSIDYFSVNTSFYRDFYNKSLMKKSKNRIRRVMVIGYPMTPFRPMEEVGLFFYFRLEFEYKILSFLKKNGFEVIYKVHPDRANEIEGFYSDVVDKFIKDPFEDVYDYADAFVFGLTSTSTFGYALCTNKPITLFDIHGSKWNQNKKNQLKKRVTFVDAKLSRAQKITFSEEDLINSLVSPKNSDSWGNFEKYFD